MKIIKNGDISRLRKHIEFLCESCGCQFIADDTECESASLVEFVNSKHCEMEAKYGRELKCKCPTCGYMVYKHCSSI